MTEADPAPTAPGPPGPEGEDPGRDPRLAGLEAQVAELRDRLARARADYDNLQKRTTREAQVERERNKARVLEAFLPLAELAHMAAHQAEAHPGPLSEGVVMLAREFDRLLAREGVTRIGAVGEAADPARHEVLATEPAEGVAPGAVTRVIQPGYLLGGRVLRYAKVAVAPAAPATPSPGAAPAAPA